VIARLRGALLEKRPGSVVVEVNGVGYEVTVPVGTYTALGEVGGTVELHVHTHVREDMLALFGFGKRLEKELFVRLLAVNGVGPKTALALLSGLGADRLVEAVRQRDVKHLASVPGVGRKTAERIGLEIGDRLASLTQASEAAGPGAPATRATLRDDVVSALENLGYNARAAAEAAEGAFRAAGRDGAPTFESLFKQALRSVSR
jgi:holliday junction DNA helicase RuvA